MKFGNEAWDVILKKSQLDEHDSFLMFTRYDDTQTFSLVGAVSDTLGVPVEAVLEIFGEFFFDYCLRHGYDKMLRTLGSDIKSFIQNLDSLHSLLALSYKGISAPSFSGDYQVRQNIVVSWGWRRRSDGKRGLQGLWGNRQSNPDGR
ncbi:hypothetical protein RRG08_028034 [Elysia crispata]|uniref:Heme NO-binding domain-containing protein n=1 Tax=Elysia crispata TaxID=231223 RepID=A0AAE1ED13_9GAST|nr:hypothetical protein RRG08_028034 [Elysia crispata]